MSYSTPLWFFKVSYTLWGHNLINDIEARKRYQHNVAQYSLQMEEEDRRGHLRVAEAAELASENRNRQVVERRAASSALVESIARFLKKEAPSYEDKLEQYASSIFGKNFDNLNLEKKNVVSKAMQGLDSPALICPFSGAEADSKSVRPQYAIR